MDEKDEKEEEEAGKAEEGKEKEAVMYLTWMISRPSLTSCGSSLTSFLFWLGRSTVFTPARSAPINFSLMPPTAVTRPRREISP
jgi:hypothetical protein